MTITEFLTARYDEREAAARAVRGRVFASWNRSWDDGSMRDLVIDGERVATLPIDMDEHIALNDPAYVLADIAAKRAILEFVGDEYPHVAILLAQPYAEHPDFDPAWSVA